MKQKNNFRLKSLSLLSLMFAFTIALALSSYASSPFVCNVTTASSVLSASGTNTVINVTYGAQNLEGAGIADYNGVNITIFLTSTQTANSTEATGTIAVNISNSSKYHMGNITLNTSAINSFEDGLYTVQAIVYNSTSGDGGSNKVTCATKSVTIDRTAPSIATSISPTGRNVTTKDQTFSASVNGANTTQCTLTFLAKNPGSTAYVMTHSGDTCTQSINDIAEGSYAYTITTSDGTNASISAQQDITISLKGSAARKAKVFNALGGGGKSQESIGKGLAIAQSTRAGEVSQGLAKAQAKINEIVARETQGKELTKTGIGLGTGIAIGVLVPTLVIPGVGLITAPILGGLIGLSVGVAV